MPNQKDGRTVQITCEPLERRVLFAVGDVLTYHNDNSRTGTDLHEKVLTPANVNTATFGKLFEFPVDGKVDAEPLYVSRLAIPGKGRHNVVITATEHDSVYAFDAGTGQEIWHVSVLGVGEMPSDPRNSGQIIPEIGITSTPVIDRAAGPHGTIFLVAMSKDASGNYFQRIHALDLVTGIERFAPRTIQATYPGTGDNSSNGFVVFDAAQYDDRAALLLSHGVIYTSWASHGDIRPYTSWIIGYSERKLKQVSVLNLTPNGNEGAFWGSGGGPAADAAGNLYIMAGNGTFDSTLNAKGFPAQGDYGNAFLELSPRGGLHVVDYFIEFDQASLNAADLDLGSSAPLVLPPMRDAAGRTRLLVIGAGKDGKIFVVDRRHMGKFNTATADNSNVYQEALKLPGDGVFSTPAYFNGTVYYGPVADHVQAFSLAHARLSATPTSEAGGSIFTYPGATPSVSANGKKNGIVWVVENAIPSVLFAYDATDLSHELYDSSQNLQRDTLGPGNKFITPTIANGHVFVGTTNSVAVFGLL